MPTNQKEQSQNSVLLDIVNRSQTVINGLTDNIAWNIVLEDIGKQCKQLDDNWQFVDDPKKMQEFRITKMAVMKIKNLLDDYKFDRDRAEQELKVVIAPDKNIEKDTDNEGVEDGEETPVG